MDYHSMVQEHIRNNPPKFIHGYGRLTPIQRLAIATKPKRVFKMPSQKAQ